MYAVIATGGKQEKVSTGQRVAVELLGASAGDEVSFVPILLVDEGAVTSDSALLAGASVKATVIEEVRGPKIRGFTYKSKSNNRRRWGHRQNYHVVEVTEIAAGSR
ncbi:MAG TPA: 50S ribosomal protein L21 [Acidimicrobiales bacterium]|nr:50S ribosomal protein L21 [Acidimicrobiales bacterium]